MMLALTNDDETNIIMSAVARKIVGVSYVNNSEYNKLKDVLGISKVIDPNKQLFQKFSNMFTEEESSRFILSPKNQAEVIHRRF